MKHKYYKLTLKYFLLFAIILPSIFFAMSIIAGDYLIGKRYYCYKATEGLTRWFEYKENKMKQAQSAPRRIIFLSGSNILFGVDANLIEETIKMPTINYGSHAGLGNYIFYNAKRVLKSGDILFLPLEYEYYNLADKELKLNNIIIEYIIDNDNCAYRDLPYKDKLLVIRYLFNNFGKIISNQSRERFKLTNKPYDLDEKGNIVGNIATKEDFIKKHKLVDIRVKQIPADYQQLEIYKFIQWCKNNDIAVYGIAPNIYHPQPPTPSEELAFAEIRKFYQLCGVNFIGDFTDGFFSDQYMYDTIYHLNHAGRLLRTNYLIDKIKEIIHLVNTPEKEPAEM